MTIQTSPSLVVIGGMTFGNVDDTMTGWVYTNLQGWYDSAGVRATFTPRTFDHGSFDSPVYRDVRTVTLSGTYLGSSYTDAVAAATTLSALLADGSAGTVTVDSITATVRLGVEPVYAWIGDAAFQYQVSFIAVDPRKYGPTFNAGAISMPTSGGGLIYPLYKTLNVLSYGTIPAPQVASLTNTGTAATSVVMTVAAGGATIIGGFQITETVTGSVLQYSDDLPAGSSVVFDTGAGSVILNGQANRRGSLTIAQWWQIPPGATRSVIFAGITTTSVTATLAASMRPAYW